MLINDVYREIQSEKMYGVYNGKMMGTKLMQRIL